MAYTFCDQMLDGLATWREHEEDPATRQALFAAINAFIDEHRRHSGLEPLLSTRVIDMIDDPDDEEECNSVIAGPCGPMSTGLLEMNKAASAKVAESIIDELGLDLLKKHAPPPATEE